MIAIAGHLARLRSSTCAGASCALALRERFARVHNFLLHKWYFDELYDAAFVRPDGRRSAASAAR